MCPNYSYECTNWVCRISFVDNVPMAERDTHYTERECPSCREVGSVKRLLDMPNLMQTALPDGTKRRGWNDLREASKINKQMAGLPPEQRGEASNEIKKLNVKFEK